MSGLFSWGTNLFRRPGARWTGRTSNLSTPTSASWGLGQANDKIRIFQESDIFAFPTWYPLEGQPVAMIEAMAAGLPVLTTRHATIPDILGEDGAAYVNKQDPGDIAAKLLLLLSDEALRKCMGQKNQDRFLQHHTADRFAAGVVRVFHQALSVQSPSVDCLEMP